MEVARPSSSTYQRRSSRQGAGERNWSTHGFIVSRLGNKLSALRVKKLVCVYYNFGLCNTRVTRKMKRVDYEAEAFERDSVQGSDVPVEGWVSENSQEEIEEGA